MSKISQFNNWSEQQCLDYLQQTDSEHWDTLRAKCRDKFLQKESISLEDVIFVEKEIINQQRLNRLLEKSPDSPDDSDYYYGIAISGGGIRSASFALGILQALCQSKKLKYFDYVSAVSGGGYIASCLTWFNRKKRDDPKFQKDDSTTPFCKSFNTDATVDPKNTEYKNNTPLNYLRQNGKYLTPTQKLNTLALAGTVAGNAVVAAAVYFSCLLIVFWLLHGLYFYTEFATNYLGSFKTVIWGDYTTGSKLMLHLLVYILLVFLLLSAVNTIRVDKQQKPNIVKRKLAQKYENRRNLQMWIGNTVSIIIVIAILATLPNVASLISLLLQSMAEGDGKPKLKFGDISVGVVLGVIGTIYQFFRQNIPEKKYSIITDIRIILTAMILVYSVLLFTWKFSVEYASLLNLLLYPSDSYEAWVIAIIPLLFVMLGWVMNINYFGIRQMYRDRLMEIFLPNIKIFDENKEDTFEWNAATGADQANIRDMCGPEDFGPYLILNANAVLMNSKNARYRNRGGDNYMLSSQFIGCYATGWSHITKLKYPAPLTLGAAMSISGAAVNPHAGVGGKGLTRGRLVSMILGFLNIRLGYWFENPASASKKVKCWKKLLNRPSLLFPGIKGVLGIGSDENDDYIELTDGGHFDNTGLYELFRRKLKVILLSQAGADPDFTVDDIGNAIQRVRADFGAHVYFVPDYGLNELVPGASEPVGLSSKIELSRNPYAIALIKYAADEFGVLIIIKTVLTKGLSADLYSYKLSNKNFPNQSTTDQFFSEDQFEAYRELGFGLCYKMLSGEFGKNLSSSKFVEAVRWKSLPAYKPDIYNWEIEECRGFLGNGTDKAPVDDPNSLKRLQKLCEKKILKDKEV